MEILLDKLKFRTVIDGEVYYWGFLDREPFEPPPVVDHQLSDQLITFDKNGKEVYCNDIVSQGSFERQITITSSCGSCCNHTIGFAAEGAGHGDFIDFSEPFEVIGNIYEKQMKDGK